MIRRIQTYKLYFELLTDTIFSSRTGTVGVVTRQTAHDQDGLPYIRGRTLKGLLAEECATLLFALQLNGQTESPWRMTAESLFGRPGSTLQDRGLMRISDGRLPDNFRQAVSAALEKAEFTDVEIYEALTTIRYQTAINEYGTAAPGTLRSTRVLLPGIIFEAEIIFEQEPMPEMISLLSACILSWRRAGLGRNRGWGRLKAHLENEEGIDITKEALHSFRQAITKW